MTLTRALRRVESGPVVGDDKSHLAVNSPDDDAQVLRRAVPERVAHRFLGGPPDQRDGVVACPVGSLDVQLDGDSGRDGRRYEVVEGSRESLGLQLGGI